MSLKTIQEVLKEIAALEERIRNADPNAMYKVGGKLVSQLDRLKEQLATAKKTLDNLQNLSKAAEVVQAGEKAVKAGETVQAGATVARGGGVVTRVFTTIGRAIGFGSGTAATVAGIALTTAVLIGVTYGTANYLGSRAGDKPVQLGSRALSPVATPRQAQAAQGAGPYFIFSINASGPNIVVGGKSDVAKQSCAFVDGGNACQPGDANVQVLETLGGPYETYDQAVATYCGMVTNSRPYFGGYKGTINGKDYWLDNAPACSP